MKKFIILFIFFMFAGIINSQSLVVSTDTLRPYIVNDSITVPIRVKNFQNIGAITIRLQFDPNVLSFGRALNWDTSVPGALAGIVDGNKVSIAWDGIPGMSLANGKLCDLRFKFKGGNSPLSFVTSECEIVNDTIAIMTVSYKDGAVIQLFPPNPPLLLSPDNGEINISTNPLLLWSHTTLTDYYNLQVGRDSLFTTIVANDSTLTDTSKVLSGLESLTKYYWRVKSKNQAGWSSFSNWNNFTTLQVCSSVSLTMGWNILSVPLLASNMNTQTLFTNFTSPTYGFSNGYTTATTLVCGKGYWLRYANASTISICGANTGAIAIPINQGWNLIGGYEKDVTIANVTTTPSGIISSPFYGYANGYVVPTILKVGKGYWVRASQSGVINIPTGLSKAGSDAMIAGDIKAEWGRIIVTDNEGRTGILYSAKGNVNLGSFDLPPVPPADVFDLRFSSDRNVEILGSQSKEIKINSKSYPVTIQAEGINIKLKDVITGKLLDKTIMDGKSIVLQKDFGILSVETAAEITSYSLEQNYPNPFNPSAKIRYALPSESNVKIIIYNSLGEKVKELVNNLQGKGYYEVVFDAAGCSSGVYFYTLYASSLDGKNNFKSVKKMILLK